MAFLGLSATGWSALTAIGTFTLAAVTVITLIVTVRRDNKIREDDRTENAKIRKEDRDRDDQLRREQQERDDRLRREDAEKTERRYRAQRRNQEDFEARQVTVELASSTAQFPQDSRVIIVSAPATYPIKQVAVAVASRSNGGLSINSDKPALSEPASENGRTIYRIPAEVPEMLGDPQPIAQFTDRHGNLYFRYLGHTMRMAPGTTFSHAAREIDLFNRTGPKPDDPE